MAPGRPFPGGGGRTPRPSASPAAARATWRDALVAVRVRADQVLAGSAYDKVVEAPLARAVMDAVTTRFPVGDMPAQAMADGFRPIAKAFLTTQLERRQVLATALKPLAWELEKILDAAALAASEVWQGQSGGRDR